MAKMVFSGLVTAWRLAGCPTRTSPESVNATTEGVVREPSAFSITLALPPSMTATTEFVVPRSIPTTLAMLPLQRHALDCATCRTAAATPVGAARIPVLVVSDAFPSRANGRHDSPKLGRAVRHSLDRRQLLNIFRPATSAAAL